MAGKVKKTTKNKKAATKTTVKAVKPAIKSSVTGKKACLDKPAMGKIVCLCVAVIAILVIIAAIMLGGQTFGNNYFVSDNTKYVLNISVDGENEDGAVATHAVYYYKDDSITGIKYYYEFKDEASAKKFYDKLMAALESDEEDSEDVTYELKGKYVIATAGESAYKDLSASDVKAYIELYEKYSNGDYTEEEVEEDGSDESEEENEE